jgi:hypothetical protein
MSKRPSSAGRKHHRRGTNQIVLNEIGAEWGNFPEQDSRLKTRQTLLSRSPPTVGTSNRLSAMSMS